MAQTTAVTHYDLLGVSQTATDAEIKKAYQKALRTSHPDVGGNAGMFRLVQEAYETLSDPRRRAAYDQSLASASSSRPDPSAGRTRQDPPRPKPEPKPEPQAKQEPVFRDMETPPAPRPWSGPAMEFHPPLVVPEPEPFQLRRKAPKWVIVWMVVFLVVLAVTCGFPIFMYGLIQATGAYPKEAFTFGDLMSGVAVNVIWWGLVAFVPLMIAKRRRRMPDPLPKAEDFLPKEALMARVHGEPGRDLSVARFGDNAKLGVEGEKRTSRLIAETVLPGLPGARLINGLRWPGTEHADIDHAVILDNRIAVIDSKMWTDGNYWWDNKQLFRDGRSMDPFKLGSAVAALRAAYPNCIVEGWVVIHSPSGELNRPYIERAGMNAPQGRAAVSLVNARELTDGLYAFLDGADAGNLVNVPVLAAMLRGML